MVRRGVKSSSVGWVECSADDLDVETLYPRSVATKAAFEMSLLEVCLAQGFWDNARGEWAI